jgi:hypothetical protein
MASSVLRLALTAALLPVPIGSGPRYHPPPGANGSCTRAPLESGRRVHVELFARGLVVIVPAAIGLRGARFEYGRVVTARCRTRIWTTEPTGVTRFAGAARLGDLFRVWGRALVRDRVLSFEGRVRLYRNGVRVPGDPRRLALRDGDELVLEVGKYVPPHRSYLFPP